MKPDERLKDGNHSSMLDTVWLRQQGEHSSPEERVRVRRALGQLVTLRGAVEKYTSGYTFAASEALYGMSLQTGNKVLNSKRAQ